MAIRLPKRFAFYCIQGVQFILHDRPPIEPIVGTRCGCPLRMPTADAKASAMGFSVPGHPQRASAHPQVYWLKVMFKLVNYVPWNQY